MTIFQRTYAIEGTTQDDARWLTEAVAPVNGHAVFEDGRVVIDETAFWFLCDLDENSNGCIEQVSGGLAMYADGNAYPVHAAGQRGLHFGEEGAR